MTENQRVQIIAEAGVNHNGSLEKALQLIDIAKESGADAVKFQTFKAEALTSHLAPKADYQKRNTANTENQLKMLQRLELDEGAHRKLIDHCKAQNIQFLSSPFDEGSLELLVNRFDLPRIKISSGEITNLPFLLKIATTGKPVILSTGMSTLGEIESALGALAFGYMGLADKPALDVFQEAFNASEGQSILQKKVILLHCTTEYPAAFEEVNLNAMKTLQSAFGLPVGLSDHTPGIAVSIAAVARGASVIEKHFTISRDLPGPDHRASLEPAELKSMVQAIRQVEVAMGSPRKSPTPSESKNRIVARKSLVAACDILQGTAFSMENVTIKRPGSGVSPGRYWEIMGKKALRDYKQDELIEI
ncbi:MAG TPA: N-acetylneuraminate synthase [Firmicutes bacterium]|jgi:N-acetylneuraminate synthase|nr:N-acetylneuraminate synthase [Bacillota bacterium]